MFLNKLFADLININIEKVIVKSCCRCDGLAKVEGEIMYIVDATNPDVGFAVQLGEITDAEGNVIDPSEVKVEINSDNVAAVEVTPDSTGLAGTVHFGAPGRANINVVVSDKDDQDLLGSFGAQFTVIAGDPSTIAGGTIAFEGLSEADPGPAPEPEPVP